MPQAVPATLLTPNDVARILNVSPAWVRDHATRKQPRIPALKLGKLLRFRPEDITLFLEELRKLLI
jgi:DNA-binding transcriptional regulator YiaG